MRKYFYPDIEIIYETIQKHITVAEILPNTIFDYCNSYKTIKSFKLKMFKQNIEWELPHLLDQFYINYTQKLLKLFEKAVFSHFPIKMTTFSEQFPFT